MTANECSISYDQGYADGVKRVERGIIEMRIILGARPNEGDAEACRRVVAELGADRLLKIAAIYNGWPDGDPKIDPRDVLARIGDALGKPWDGSNGDGK